MRRVLCCILGVAAAGSLATACQRERPTALTPGEGYVHVPGGRVWYRIVGKSTGTPLLLLHGGPGAASYYLKPLAALGDERPVIFYDQLGGGHSDHPSDSTLWTIDGFVNRLEALRDSLGLAKVDLFGHSWGTILGVEYTLRYPEHVRSLILASPALSIPRWAHDADSLRATLPDSLQQAIARHEADGTFDAPEYQNATMAYYGLYLARRQPWSADIDSTFAALNPEVYGYMQGPSEFTITGTLKDYDVTDSLSMIGVPTLFTAGDHDEAAPSTVRYYASLVPGAEVEIIPNSGHLTMQDQPERYVEVLRRFLDRVDAGRK